MKEASSTLRSGRPTTGLWPCRVDNAKLVHHESQNTFRDNCFIRLLLFLPQSRRRRQAPHQETERNRCAGGEPHGCGERRKGPGTALVRRPRSNYGAREVWRSQTRMAGLDLLVTFGAMPKVTRRKGGTGSPGNKEAAYVRRERVARITADGG